MKQTYHNVNTQRGFTLLELLVASAVLLVIGGAAYVGWYQVQQAKTRTEQQADRLEQLQRTFYWMRDDFGQAINRPISNALGSEEQAFAPNSFGTYQLSFTRTGWSNPAADVLPPRSHLQRIAYGLEEDKLYRYYWYTLDRQEDKATKRQLLVEKVQRLEIRYMDNKRNWAENWPPANADPNFKGLPFAVELTLELDDLGEFKRLFALPGQH